MIAASGCDDFFHVCPTADPALVDSLPERLSEAGLYRDIATGELAAGVRPYEPRFELWSDGAEKQRWIAVPEGARIDSSDTDAWELPAGTRLFKEFSIGGVKLETRLLARLANGRWAAVSYRWRQDGSDADAAVLGALDTGGTGHDIPAAGECAGCHGGRASFVLGYSAIQLAPDQLDPELLSDMPGDLTIPGEPEVVAALGYFHANCGHCHNADSPRPKPCMDPNNALDFWLRSDRLESPEQTPTYQSAVGTVITPGDPGSSFLIERITSRELFFRMPPLGTERVDREAVAMLSRWIEGLAP